MEAMMLSNQIRSTLTGDQKNSSPERIFENGLCAARHPGFSLRNVIFSLSLQLPEVIVLIILTQEKLPPIVWYSLATHPHESLVLE